MVTKKACHGAAACAHLKNPQGAVSLLLAIREKQDKRHTAQNQGEGGGMVVKEGKKEGGEEGNQGEEEEEEEEWTEGIMLRPPVDVEVILSLLMVATAAGMISGDGYSTAIRFALDLEAQRLLPRLPFLRLLLKGAFLSSPK